MADTLVINISGRRFEVDRNLLAKHPRSTLGQLSNTDQTEVSFQRPCSIFKSVLAFYQTDHLHVPLSVCPGVVQEELEYWGFSVDDLDPCCRRKMKKFHSEQEDFIIFEKSLSDSATYGSMCCYGPETCLTRGRQFMWRILNEPSSSIIAKIYFILSSLIIILSILLVFLNSMSDFKKTMTRETWVDYIGDDLTDDQHDKMDLIFGDRELLENETYEDLMGNFTLPSNAAVENPIFGNIQLFCTAFFISELLLRILCCPSLIQFFKSFLNIIDILAVALSLIEMVAEQVSAGERYTHTYMDALGALQVVRVLRLLRLAREITGARVLAFAVSRSLKEIAFMALLLAINTVLFGTLAYSVNSEKMTDLPTASWWALITTTTVGYGDIVPSNHGGKFVGVLCACMGIMVLALTMPLFVDNFLTFYSYAHEVYKEKAHRERNVIKVTPVKSKTGEQIPP